MEQKKTIQDILAQREAFLVIGLTGRMGSGCSKVAEMLANSFDDMKFPHPEPQNGQTSLSEDERILRILAEYAEEHWVKFDVIHVASVIATFILDDSKRFIQDLYKDAPLKTEEEYEKEFKEYVLMNIYNQSVELGKRYNILKKDIDNLMIQKLADISTWRFTLFELGECKIRNRIRTLIRDIKKMGGINVSFLDQVDNDSFGGILEDSDSWKRIIESINNLFREDVIRKLNVNRREYLEKVDELLSIISYGWLLEILNITFSNYNKSDFFWRELRKINMQVVSDDLETLHNDSVDQIYKYIFVKYITQWFGSAVREYVKKVLGRDAYARLFQRYGQMIRYHCCIPSLEGENENKGKKQDIFAIPRRINQHIKVLRHPVDSKEHRPVRIVVDSIKNIFEAVYLQYRYSAFYLWAITTDKDIRKQRLQNKHLNDVQIRKLEWNEYPDIGCSVIKRVKKMLDDKEGESAENIQNKIKRNCKNDDIKAEIEFYINRTIDEDEKDVDIKSDDFNNIRLKFYEDGTYVFYVQDIDSCVCNADVYLFNNVKDATDTENSVKLLQTIVRNVALVMYPGLVKPTPIERCMQIALSAKVNSGCLSRQVGAVVTDSQFNILAIGWNDVPCGEISCAYKNLKDIYNYADLDAYSDYELHNADFRCRIENKMDNWRTVNFQGLPVSYCFKEVHKEGKDPMRSRAMHAEEKALALCGREAEGGYLFTTASPCEMCSKNVKNHRIQRIYYLEAYPGISQEQYTNSGDKENRAELILFSGAVGRAYMQMYTPLLPHKDVLKYLRQ